MKALRTSLTSATATITSHNALTASFFADNAALTPPNTSPTANLQAIIGRATNELAVTSLNKALRGELTAATFKSQLAGTKLTKIESQLSTLADDHEKLTVTHENTRDNLAKTSNSLKQTSRRLSGVEGALNYNPRDALRRQTNVMKELQKVKEVEVRHTRSHTRTFE